MSTNSNKDTLDELVDVKLDTKKHSKRPKGTYTDDNGEVLGSVPVGHTSGRAVDPNFPSRSTDPRPGISGVKATDPQPGTSGVQTSRKKFKKSKATPDLKSGHESPTQSGCTFSNPSSFQTSVLRTGNNSVVGKLQRDSEPVVDDSVPVTDLRKSSKRKKKSKKAKKAIIGRDASSPSPFDYLNEADHILLDLEEFDHTCPPSISNPRLGSGNLISNSKWLTGKTFTSIGDKLSSDDTDSDINIDELLAPYLDDTAQANKKKVAEPAESPAVSAKPHQVEKISTRVKKIRREMRDPDTQAKQKTVAETSEPSAVTAKDPQVEKSSTRVKKIRREMRDPDTQANQKAVAETSEPSVVAAKDPNVEKSSTRVKKIRRGMHDPDPQTNQKTVSETSEPSVVTAKDPQVETSSTRVKKIRRKMREPDTLANQQTVEETSESPAVTEKDPHVETSSTPVKKIRRKMRDPDTQANLKTVAETSESPTVTAKHPHVEKNSSRQKKMRRELLDPEPQANKETVAEAAEFPAVTTKPKQAETISARREMRDYDPQVTENLARKEEVRDHFDVPKRRPKKKKQWEVSGADHFIDETEPISTSQNNKEKPMPDIPVPSATLSTNSSHSSVSLYEEVAVIHINRKQTREPDSRSNPSKKPARLPPLQNARPKPPPNRPARSKPPKRPARQPQLKNAPEEVLYDIFGRKLDDPAKTLQMPRRVPDLDSSTKRKRKSDTDETCSAFSDDEERQTMVFQGHAISEPQGPTPNIRHIIINSEKKKQKKSCIKKLIPCLNTSKDNEQEQCEFNSLEQTEYLEIKDAKSIPSERKDILTRLSSFLSWLLRRQVIVTLKK